MRRREDQKVRKWSRIALVMLLLLIIPPHGYGQMMVMDLGNLVENVISAIESIEGVAQQASQLSNEENMLSNEVSQLEQLISILNDLRQNSAGGSTVAWGEVGPTLDALARAIQVGHAISYDLGNLSSEFQRRFPGYVPPTDWNQSYREWSESSLDTLRGTLLSAGRNVGDASSVQAELDALRSANQSTDSRLDAIQIGNQLASLEIAEMTKLRQLVAAQITSQNTYAASEEARRAGADA
ncbi:MAG TPA: P-type conjugative transfer protein TrbJ, partial [Deltaproteobacteria bacterium]|nr:P-type conjugative transfer protein TrbJ [Deltaproteobacteria bacterium]